MKKICFIVNKLYNGGAERVVSILANSLSNNNFEVTVLCFEKNVNDYYMNPNVKRQYIYANKSIVKVFFDTIVYLYKEDFDVLIGFDILPNLICSFFSLISKKKVIISERNAPKQVKINPILKFMRYFLYGFVDVVVFQTEEAKNYYRRKIKSKGIVIKNPVTPGLPKRRGNNKEIIALGRLTTQKNYELFINAALKLHNEFPNYKFKIYGQGELKNNLQDKIDQANAGEYIILEGYYVDVCDKIVDSDIYVMTSLYEGMPNSLIEAMCMGFPVVSSDCPSGGPRELINHGRNGLLFKNNNENDLIIQLRRMINNKDEKEMMGRNAMKLNSELKQEVITKKWIDLILSFEEVNSD